MDLQPLSNLITQETRNNVANFLNWKKTLICVSLGQILAMGYSHDTLQQQVISTPQEPTQFSQAPALTINWRATQRFFSHLSHYIQRHHLGLKIFRLNTSGITLILNSPTKYRNLLQQKPSNHCKLNMFKSGPNQISSATWSCHPNIYQTQDFNDD